MASRRCCSGRDSRSSHPLTDGWLTFSLRAIAERLLAFGSSAIHSLRRLRAVVSGATLPSYRYALSDRNTKATGIPKPEVDTLDPMATKRKNSPGKPTLTREESARVHEGIAELLGRHPPNRQGGPNASALAKQLGVSQPTVSEWVSKNSSPSLPELEKIAQHLETTELELRKGTLGRLEIALSYHGRDTWPDRVIRRARALADEGLDLTAQEWAGKLDELVNAKGRE